MKKDELVSAVLQAVDHETDSLQDLGRSSPVADEPMQLRTDKVTAQASTDDSERATAGDVARPDPIAAQQQGTAAAPSSATEAPTLDQMPEVTPAHEDPFSIWDEEVSAVSEEQQTAQRSAREGRSPSASRSSTATASRDRTAEASASGSLQMMSLRGLDPDDASNIVHSNPKYIPFWFLGTSSLVADSDAHTASLVMRAHNELWVFDCGDDTQRQLLRVASSGVHMSVRQLKICRIFITSLAGPRVYGLPGFLCILSAAKYESKAQKDTPIHVYGPPGLAQYLETMLTVSDTFLVMPVVVHEFVTEPLGDDPDDLAPQLLQRRSKLYRVSVPPDQYNPDGFLDASLKHNPWTDRGRHKDRHGRPIASVYREDVRGNWLPPELPEPGQPYPEHVLSTSDLTWTLALDSAWKVVVVATDSPVSGLSFVVTEPSRVGNLLVEKCEELGVKKGRNYGLLKAGQAVDAEDGSVVHPHQVMTQDSPGRTIVVAGPHSNAAALSKAAPRSDVLLQDAWLGDPDAVLRAGLTPAAKAWALGQQLSVGALFLWSHGRLKDSGLCAAASSQADRAAFEELGDAAVDTVFLAPRDMDLVVVGHRGSEEQERSG